MSNKVEEDLKNCYTNLRHRTQISDLFLEIQTLDSGVAISSSCTLRCVLYTDGTRVFRSANYVTTITNETNIKTNKICKTSEICHFLYNPNKISYAVFSHESKIATMINVNMIRRVRRAECCGLVMEDQVNCRARVGYSPK